MSAVRRCPICGESLEGRRSDARYCGGRCRAEGSRLRRLLAGEEVDGFRSIGERLSAARRRTERAGDRLRSGEAA